MSRVECYGITDRGRERTTNQDHFMIARLQKSLKVEHSSIANEQQSRFSSSVDGRLLLVADGMGGHVGGERASQIAINCAVAYVLHIIPWFDRLSRDGDDNVKYELKRALEYCQQQLEREANSDSGHRDMGTTLTMAYLVGRQLYVVHVGDSRAYLFRQGNLHQITRDHTVAQNLVDAGQLPPESLGNSPWSHVLWNAIGGSEHSALKPDVYKSEVDPDDYVVLCTDGLTRHVNNDTLVEILSRAGSVEEKCHLLVKLANQEGGRDNITVVMGAIGSADVPIVVPDVRRPEDSIADTADYFPPT